MTVEQLITRYVYQHGEISLQGIGTIKLLDAVPDVEYLQKHKLVVINGLEFVHQKMAVTTPDFVKYYATQRGKIASLATNDIEAFLGMATQFLNIGNPFEIKGLGTLSKINDGTLLMAPGFFIITKEEEATGKLKERQVDTEDKSDTNFYGEKEQKTSPLVKILLGAMLAIVIVAGGWWLYKSITQPDTAQEVAANGGDTLLVPQANTAVDTPAVQTTPVAMPVDSLTVVSWKAIFRQVSGKDTAIALHNGYKKKIATPILMQTADSVTFQFYVQIQSAAKDTTFKKDSIRRFFQRPIQLERVP
ncbi:MAG TPA: hypothetical protein VLC98_16890 [Phnomibacter sp.]|nr:hypothetical protein [Phnomibacter sp.]